MVAALPTQVPTEIAGEHFAEVLARAETAKERVVLTRAGRPVAAVVPIEDIEALEAAEDAADARDAAAALAEYERSGQQWPSSTVAELAARWGISPTDDAIG